MSNMSFSDWYAQLQCLIDRWIELSRDRNWVEAHKEELERQGINPSELNLQKDIDILTHQILHYGEEK